MNNKPNGTIIDMLQFHAEYFRNFLQPFIGFSIGLFFSCLAMVANFIVIVIIFKKKQQRTPFDFVIASLSILDFSASVCNLIFAAYMVRVIFLRSNEFEMHHNFQNNIALDISIMFFYLSLMHVLLITFLRFFALFWPMKFRQFATKAFIKALIAATWTLSVIAGFTKRNEEKRILLQSDFLAVCCHVHVLQQISKFFSMSIAFWQSHLYQSILLAILCFTSSLAIGLVNEMK